MESPRLKYTGIIQSLPTILIDIGNPHYYNYLGLTAILVLSIGTNKIYGSNLGSNKNENLNCIGRNSFTNIEISNIPKPKFTFEALHTEINEDYLYIYMSAVYSGEFKIKVKSFKVERFIPSTF